MSKLEEESHDTLGELLTSTRKAVGISIEALCEKTHLPIFVVQSLESGDYSPLPATPYVRAFLVTLSKELNLDSAKLQSLFQPNPIKKPEAPVSFVRKEKETLKIKRNLPVKWAITLVGSVLILILFTLFRNSDKDTVVKQETASLPHQKKVSPSLPTKDTTAISPKKDTTQAIIPSKKKAPAFTKKKTPALNKAKQKKKNKTSALLSKKKVLASQNLKKKNKTAFLKKIRNSRSSPSKTRIKFTCKKDSIWLLITKKGKRKHRKTLYKNQNWFINHSDTVWVKSGVFGGMEVTVNGNIFNPQKQNYTIFGSSLVE